MYRHPRPHRATKSTNAPAGMPTWARIDDDRTLPMLPLSAIYGRTVLIALRGFRGAGALRPKLKSPLYRKSRMVSPADLSRNTVPWRAVTMGGTMHSDALMPGPLRNPGANLTAEQVDDPALLIDPHEAHALATGMASDPFALLGPHAAGRDTVVRTFVPPAEAVEAIDAGGTVLARLSAVQTPGLFCGRIPTGAAYRLRIHWPGGLTQETEDPYGFGLLLGELDLHLFAEGTHQQLGRCLGAQAMEINGIPGARFAVWAPNARRVSVVGDFNGW